VRATTESSLVQVREKTGVPRTDTRARVIRSSLELMRRRGYAGTAISDIVTESQAPRGSVTFHFPGGKEEIAGEVVDLMTRDILDQVDRAADRAATAAAVIRAQIAEIGGLLESSGWVAGCPVAPITVELADDSEAIRRASAHFFSLWQASLARRLADRGLDEARATRVAAMAIYAIEGALVVCRAERGLEPLHVVADEISLLCECGGAAPRVHDQMARSVTT
jgi:TetR/AcrR family transcriptional repressor of lmrAB and yxaGH operons